MKEKTIIIIIALSLAVTFVALSLRERFLADPAHSDWWSLSFASQQATDASFTVSNFGPTRLFFYEIRAGKTVTKSASFTLNGTSEQTIAAQNPDKKPVTIRVWTENDTNRESKELSKKKEIYIERE